MMRLAAAWSPSRNPRVENARVAGSPRTTHWSPPFRQALSGLSAAPETRLSPLPGAWPIYAQLCISGVMRYCRSGGHVMPEQPGKGPAHKRRSVTRWQISMRNQHPLDWPSENFIE
jgi:hypothetical protein